MNNKIISNPLTAYLFSPCKMAGSGLKEVLEKQGFHVYLLTVNESFPSINTGGDINSYPAPDLYVFYVPDEVFYFLLTMVNIEKSIRGQSLGIDYIFVSSVSCPWLYQNLIQMENGQRFAIEAKIVSSSLSVKRLDQYFQRVKKNLPFTLFKDVAINKTYDISEGLTMRETEVLLNYFRGEEVAFTAKNSKESLKTLYYKRRSGLRKMVANSEELAKKIPGASKRWRIGLPESKISSYEKEFISGIEDQEVYHVYQPIVNSTEDIIGFEILTRWHHKGRVIPPNEFITGLKTESVLQLLTVMSLKKAIEGINRYEGKFFFSVNIHPNITGCSDLVKMCAEVCCQLKELEWKKQLVLEYSERTYFCRSSSILDVVKSLSMQGISLYLDDCFSKTSVFFPVRNYSFNGYKLDKSIVEGSLQNKEDQALIASLSGYCSMTERPCIAEGVEDNFTFQKLRELGINFFQGYLFYKPMDITELSALVHRKSYR